LLAGEETTERVTICDPFKIQSGTRWKPGK